MSRSGRAAAVLSRSPRVWGWWTNRLAASPLVGRHLRNRLLRAAGLQVGRADVGAGCWFTGPDVTLEDECYLGPGVFVEASAPVHVGRLAALGPRVSVHTSGHGTDDPLHRAGPLQRAPVVVGAGAWVGAQAVLLPGTATGPGAVVGAGAVVARDLPPHTLCLGVPARPVRPLPGADATG